MKQRGGAELIVHARNIDCVKNIRQVKLVTCSQNATESNEGSANSFLASAQAEDTCMAKNQAAGILLL